MAQVVVFCIVWLLKLLLDDLGCLLVVGFLHLIEGLNGAIINKTAVLGQHGSEGRLHLMAEEVGAKAIRPADPGEHDRDKEVVEMLPAEEVYLKLLLLGHGFAICASHLDFHFMLLLHRVVVDSAKLGKRTLVHAAEAIAEVEERLPVEVFRDLLVERCPQTFEDAHGHLNVGVQVAEALLPHNALGEEHEHDILLIIFDFVPLLVGGFCERS